MHCAPRNWPGLGGRQRRAALNARPRGTARFQAKWPLRGGLPRSVRPGRQCAEHTWQHTSLAPMSPINGPRGVGRLLQWGWCSSNWISDCTSFRRRWTSPRGPIGTPLSSPLPSTELATAGCGFSPLFCSLISIPTPPSPSGWNISAASISSSTAWKFRNGGVRGESRRKQ